MVTGLVILLHLTRSPMQHYLQSNSLTCTQLFAWILEIPGLNTLFLKAMNFGA
jgi:hypothetical protein